MASRVDSDQRLVLRLWNSDAVLGTIQIRSGSEVRHLMDQGHGRGTSG